MQAIRFCEVDSAFKHKKALFNQDHSMVLFYKTRVVSNQNQEWFRRVPILRSTKTKLCSKNQDVCSDGVFPFRIQPRQNYVVCKQETKSESVVFRFRVFREQFEQDRVSWLAFSLNSSSKTAFPDCCFLWTVEWRLERKCVVCYHFPWAVVRFRVPKRPSYSIDTNVC